MKTTLITAGIIACAGMNVQAQTTTVEKPKGQAIVQVFSNFHSGFGAANDDRGFELDRSYLGYEYSLGQGLSVKGVMDIGQSKDVSDYHRMAYIKNAMLTWKVGDFSLNGGLISTTQFNFLFVILLSPNILPKALPSINRYKFKFSVNGFIPLSIFAISFLAIRFV